MDAVGELVARLNRQKKLRIWSLIITFFGDAVVPRGSAISARTVQQVMAAMGIEAGAVRTAFSRLTQDEWVMREKIGRSSHYRLSARGHKPFMEATDRIYAPLAKCPSDQDPWALALDKEGNLQLLRQLSDCDQMSLEHTDNLVLQGRLLHLPAWLKERHCRPEQAQAFHNLIVNFEPVTGFELDPLQAMAVRCLLIHDWRRIRLQFAPADPHLWPQDWPESTCHEFVSDFYHQLLPKSESWMNNSAVGPDGPLPSPDIDLARRFGPALP